MPVLKRARSRHKQPPSGPALNRLPPIGPGRPRRLRRQAPPLLQPGKRARPQTTPHEHLARIEPTKDPNQNENPTTRAPEPRLQKAPTFAPMVQAQGKRLMAPNARVDFHPFSKTLHQWEQGVPVDCGEPWAWETIEAAVEKGAHKSATTAESIALIEEDVAYQVKAGYAKIILWEDLKRLRPRNLKVSPLAVVP
jgi:hypothetical protein